MALVTQMVDIPLTAGVDSKTTDFTASPPGTAQFSAIVNMRSDYRAGFIPRGGYTATTTSTQTSPAWIVSTPTHTFFNRAQNIYGDSAAGVAGADLAGAGSVLRRAIGSRLDQDPSSMSCVSHGSRALIGWTYSAAFSSLPSMYAWYDPATDAVTYSSGVSDIASEIKVTSGSDAGYLWLLVGSSLLAYAVAVDGAYTPRTVSNGSIAITRFDMVYDTISSSWFCIYVQGGDTKLARYTLSGSTLTMGTPVTLTANAAENVTIELAAGSGATTYIAAVYYVAATPAVTASLYTRADPPVMSVASVLSAPVSPIWSLGVCNVAPTASASPSIIAVTFEKYTSSFFPTRYAYSMRPSGAVIDIVAGVAVSGGGMSQPISKPNLVDFSTVPYVVSTDLQNSSTYSSAGWTPVIGTNAAYSYRWSCGSAVASLTHRGASIATVGSRYCIPQIWEGRVESLSSPTSGFATTSTQQTIGLVVINEATSVFAGSFPFGTAHVIPAGRLYGLDSAGLVPQGAWPVPAILASSIIASTAAGALELLNRYSYRLLKRWCDSLGNVHECVSPAFVITLATSENTITFIVPLVATRLAHALAASSAPVQTLVYRTEGNATIHYYHSTLTTAGTVVDTTADSGLNFADALTYDGGELEDQELSHVTHMTTWQGRLVALTADYNTKVYYSKPQEAFRGARFAAGLEIDFPQASGGLTAVAGMDYSLYGFTKNEIFTVSGQPAGATGEGGSLGSPEIRFRGIGCVNPKSVVLTPKGLTFQSSKGIYLILRNQELTFIGEGPFESRTATIVGAFVDEARSELHYTLSTGVEWVYDWQSNIWTSFTLPGTPLAASLQGSTPQFVTTANVYELDSSSTEVIPITMTTDWVSLTGVQGFQRVRNIELLLEYVASHTLQVDVYTDYDETTAVQTSSFVSSTDITPTPSAGKAYQLRVHVQNQKCEAIKVKLSSAVAGWKVSGITLEIGAKADNYKPRAQTTPNTK